MAIPVETAPGQVAQVDLGDVGKLYDPKTRVLRRTCVFVMVLGYSLWFTLVRWSHEPRCSTTQGQTGLYVNMNLNVFASNWSSGHATDARHAPPRERRRGARALAVAHGQPPRYDHAMLVAEKHELHLHQNIHHACRWNKDEKGKPITVRTGGEPFPEAAPAPAPAAPALATNMTSAR